MQPKHPLLGLPGPFCRHSRPRRRRTHGQLRAAHPRTCRDPRGHRRRRREVRRRERPRLLHRVARGRRAVHAEGGEGLLAAGAAPQAAGVEDSVDEDERRGRRPALPAAGGKPGELRGVGLPDARAVALMHEGRDE